jgi:flagellin-like hook-associated protein FlgL
VISLALAGMLLSGCSRQPTADIEAAAAAMASATTAEAQEYAQASFAAVQDLQAQLDSELKIQSEKFALTRSYDHAKALATEIKAKADSVATEGIQAKESVHQETTALLQEVKVTMDDVQAMLTTAPKGKGSAMDLAALQGDLDTAKATLAEAEAEFNNGKYMVAKTKILAAQSGAQTVKSAIETAIKARSGRAGGN